MTERQAYLSLAASPGSLARRVKLLQERGLPLREIVRHLAAGPAPAAGPDVLTPDCSEYPETLLHLADPPLRLFHRGRPLSSLSRVKVAVVGSRRATHFGRTWAHRLGRALTRAGLSVCSGLAAGIDGAAHLGAVEACRADPKAAPPIAVLGHGWSLQYPAEHRALRAEVEHWGALLTEYPPETPPNRWTFPARNRIIAGLVDHLVVVEAGAKSGSLHTADFALQTGRSVYVVPTRPGQPNSEGVLRLLEEGAAPLISIERFLEGLGAADPQVLPKAPALTLVQKRILTALNDEVCEPSQLARSSGVEPLELMVELAELETVGMVKFSPDGLWRPCA